MFDFSTNTIINSISAPAFKSGKRFEYLKDKNLFRVARHAEFKKGEVSAIYRRDWNEGKIFTATISAADMTALAGKVTAGTGTGRIHMYIRLSGSNNPLYANDLVFKGKPFDVEFKIKAKDTAETLAKRIVSTASKYQNMVLEYPVVTLSQNAGTLTIKGTDEYQVLTELTVEWLNPEAVTYDEVTYFSAFEPTDTTVTVEQGKEGFGTYRQLIKDMRIPTAENTRWAHPVPDETPIYGQHYTEYIVKQCVKRDITGGDAVGEVLTSVTNHVFYVLDNGATDDTNPKVAFENGIKNICDIENVNKDSDDVALTKQVIEDSLGDADAVTKAEDTAHGTKKTNDTIKADATTTGTAGN